MKMNDTNAELSVSSILLNTHTIILPLEGNEYFRKGRELYVTSRQLAILQLIKEQRLQ
jgi:hypothetical protein